ncbi:hypothetical protein [Pseudonocardia sp.]|jgi:hypothetical protein|uniref:hypothetical protein n=1 Tax=Pseudonocardia sp. TaxID=60912 RepID=UPI0031FD5C9B
MSVPTQPAVPGARALRGPRHVLRLEPPAPGRVAAPVRAGRRPHTAIDVIGRAGSLVTLAAMLVLGAAAGGALDDTPSTRPTSGISGPAPAGPAH